MSGKILKGQGSSQTVLSAFSAEGGVIRKEELQAKTKAQALIAEAQAEAKKILEGAAQLKARVEKELEVAKNQGFEEGKQAGLEHFHQEVLKLRELKEKFYADAEPQILKLVMHIAEKVIGELAVKHQEVLQKIVEQALAQALGDRIVVRLHPDDFKRLVTSEKTWQTKIERTKQLHFKEDDTIQRGGCVVETEVGTIDAQLDTQLKAIAKALGI